MTPTDLTSAFHTMQLQHPDNDWYMDTASTHHLTNDAGNLSHLFSLSNPHSILVGNGHHVPIHGHGSFTLSSPDRSYSLKQVYHVPHIIKNLISVRQFSRDNNVSIEFDPFGFTLEDLLSKQVLQRCNSTGELYPFPLPPGPRPSPVALLGLPHNMAQPPWSSRSWRLKVTFV